MVNIDTVYQRVLAFANKEQRGYITPQEFNLFANQAQMEIFEQYFYDVNQFNRIPGNETEYSSMLTLLNEKISLFEEEQGGGFISTNFPIVSNQYMSVPWEIVYRLGTIRIGEFQCEMLSSKDFDAARLLNSPLTAPTLERPISCLTKRGISILASSTQQVTWQNSVALYGKKINISYIARPEAVAWGYFVVGDKALYDPNPQKTMNFELHPSEETELVYKILKFAGVAMRREDIMKVGQGLEAAEVQQQKQ